ncbi:MAG: KamA family radical SAM protein [Spirochaetales bacterium]|nr:MAG: KamA family radical SAM protein [Spirochaetales bacterium]
MEPIEQIRSAQKLPPQIRLTPGEAEWFDRTASGPLVRVPNLPFAVTPYYIDLAGDSPADPVRRQCVPTAGEWDIRPGEEADPLYEQRYSPLPRLIHRYANRVLVLTTDQCPVYCRHCFRRYFTGGGARGNSNPGGSITAAEMKEIAAYVRNRREIREILFSGGDPLMLSDRKLLRTMELARKTGDDTVLRLCTRAPVTWPQRITPELAEGLAQLRPLWTVTQYNHPKELTAESRSAAETLISAGIPVANQTVLLRGINDDPDVLARLFHDLLTLGIKPYYLFQGDLAPGTSQFRVSLDKAFAIVERLQNLLSGLSMPQFAVDLPGGGGKVRLSRESVEFFSDGRYHIRSMEGELFSYPEED